MATPVQAPATPPGASLHKAPPVPRDVRETAQAFESLFIAQMMAPMFAGLDDDALFGGGPGQDIYRSMMVEQYGAIVAKRGGIGIADALERYLLTLQEVQT
ncbi:MAG: chemotaxis protein chel [Alphaproteobacteria bacterium]|nr:MAG: chemotaxis protein chel [Alphaproteobacteria bacterium]